MLFRTFTHRTVDLAYALHAFGVRFRFLTATLGVDPAYKAEPFYKPTLDADALRVNKLFDKAESQRIAIENRSIAEEDFVALLSKQEQLVMALVDRRYLYRSGYTRHGGMSGLMESCLSYCFSGYVGHYVLIYKYDEIHDGFLLHDPAKAPEPMFVPSRDLHTARRCHGTDEDLVIIPFAQPELRKSLREAAAACQAVSGRYLESPDASPAA